MMDDFIIGMASGLLCSFVIWFINYRFICPRIIFSNYITKTPADYKKSGYIYRFKFVNIGTRDIIDLDLFVMCRIKGLKKLRKNNWDHFRIPVLHAKIPCVKKKGNRAFSLLLEKATELQAYYIPSNIKDKIQNGEILLEDILSIGSDATIQVMVFGYDRLSGNRKLFESPLYTIKNIIEGDFKKCKQYSSIALDINYYGDYKNPNEKLTLYFLR